MGELNLKDLVSDNNVEVNKISLQFNNNPSVNSRLVVNVEEILLKSIFIIIITAKIC